MTAAASRWNRASRCVDHLFDIISEDDEFLVINKPAGLVCHPTKGDVYSSLISRVRLHLGEGESTPQMINRLDRETSGIVIIGKTLAAGAELRKQWESRAVHKEYLAIVHGPFARPCLISAPLGPDPHSEVAIKDTVVAGGAPSQTQVFPLKTFQSGRQVFSLLRVLLLTGRKHQIRIHLAHIGHPLVGDKLYGGDENLYLDFVKDRLTDEQQQRLITANHALHAGQVGFRWFGIQRSYYCQPEAWFRELAEGKAR